MQTKSTTILTKTLKFIYLHRTVIMLISFTIGRFGCKKQKPARCTICKNFNNDPHLLNLNSEYINEEAKVSKDKNKCNLF